MKGKNEKKCSNEMGIKRWTEKELIYWQKKMAGTNYEKDTR